MSIEQLHNNHPMASKIANLFHRRREQIDPPIHVEVTGNGSSVIGPDAPPIIAQILHDEFGVQGNVTIVARRIEPSSDSR